MVDIVGDVTATASPSLSKTHLMTTPNECLSNRRKRSSMTRSAEASAIGRGRRRKYSKGGAAQPASHVSRDLVSERAAVVMVATAAVVLLLLLMSRRRSFHRGFLESRPLGLLTMRFSTLNKNHHHHHHHATKNNNNTTTTGEMSHLQLGCPLVLIGQSSLPHTPLTVSLSSSPSPANLSPTSSSRLHPTFNDVPSPSGSNMCLFLYVINFFFCSPITFYN